MAVDRNLIATVFWISEEILLIDYTDKDVSITGDYYASNLERLKEVIKEEKRGKLTKGVLPLQNNAVIYKRVAVVVLHKEIFEILN